MEVLFKDTITDSNYALNGFAKLPLLPADALDELMTLFNQFCKQLTHADGQVYYSMFSNSVAKNIELSNKLKLLLHEYLRAVFNDVQVFAPMFLAKQPGHESLSLHQDWSYVHENKTPIATLWIPLSDTNEQNGALQIISGSHLWLHNYRSGNLPSARIPISHTTQPQTTTLTTVMGEAVLFHPALLHGSHPNNTVYPRVVAAMIIMPAKVYPLYFHQINPNKLYCFKMNETSFFDEIGSLSKGNAPKHIQEFEAFDYHHDIIKPEDLINKSKVLS